MYDDITIDSLVNQIVNMFEDKELIEERNGINRGKKIKSNINKNNEQQKSPPRYLSPTRAYQSYKDQKPDIPLSPRTNKSPKSPRHDDDKSPLSPRSDKSPLSPRSDKSPSSPRSKKNYLSPTTASEMFKDHRPERHISNGSSFKTSSGMKYDDLYVLTYEEAKRDAPESFDPGRKCKNCKAYVRQRNSDLCFNCRKRENDKSKPSDVSPRSRPSAKKKKDNLRSSKTPITVSNLLEESRIVVTACSASIRGYLSRGTIEEPAKLSPLEARLRILASTSGTNSRGYIATGSIGEPAVLSMPSVSGPVIEAKVSVLASVTSIRGYLSMGAILEPALYRLEPTWEPEPKDPEPKVSSAVIVACVRGYLDKGIIRAPNPMPGPSIHLTTLVTQNIPRSEPVSPTKSHPERTWSWCCCLSSHSSVIEQSKPAVVGPEPKGKIGEAQQSPPLTLPVVGPEPKVSVLSTTTTTTNIKGYFSKGKIGEALESPPFSITSPVVDPEPKVSVLSTTTTSNVRGYFSKGKIGEAQQSPPLTLPVVEPEPKVSVLSTTTTTTTNIRGYFSKGKIGEALESPPFSITLPFPVSEERLVPRPHRPSTFATGQKTLRLKASPVPFPVRQERPETRPKRPNALVIVYPVPRLKPSPIPFPVLPDEKTYPSGPRPQANSITSPRLFLVIICDVHKYGSIPSSPRQNQVVPTDTVARVKYQTTKRKSSLSCCLGSSDDIPFNVSILPFEGSIDNLDINLMFSPYCPVCMQILQEHRQLMDEKYSKNWDKNP